MTIKKVATAIALASGHTRATIHHERMALAAINALGGSGEELARLREIEVAHKAMLEGIYQKHKIVVFDGAEKA